MLGCYVRGLDWVLRHGLDAADDARNHRGHGVAVCAHSEGFPAGAEHGPAPRHRGDVAVRSFSAMAERQRGSCHLRNISINRLSGCNWRNLDRLQTSGFGPSRRSLRRSDTSGVGGEADMPRTLPNRRV
jgi:hypothetical protein